MKMRDYFLFVAVLHCLLNPCAAQLTGQQRIYQNALLEMEAKGNYQKAIDLFAKILQSNSKDRSLIARTHLQIGKCYERLGNQNAMSSYQTVITRYPEQREAVSEARTRLSELRKKNSSNNSSGMIMRQIVSSEKFGRFAIPSDDAKRIVYPKYLSDNRLILSVYDFELHETKELVELGSGEAAMEETNPKFCWSPDTKRIVYSYRIAPSYQELRLYTFATGSIEILLSIQGEVIIPASWSEDGEYILAMIHDRNEVCRIVLFSVHDHSYRELSKQYPEIFSASYGDPQLSRDGKYFVSGVKTKGKFEMKIFAVDGSSQATLTDTLRSTIYPLWSPDSRRIIFLNRREGTSDLWMVRLENGKPVGDPVLLKRDLGTYAKLLRWTRNDQLFYTQRRGSNSILSVQVDPKTGRSLSAPVRVVPFTLDKTQLYWSPSGSSIFYLSRRGMIGKKRLFIAPGREREEDEVELHDFEPIQFIVTQDSEYVVIRGFNATRRWCVYALSLRTGIISTLVVDSQLSCVDFGARIIGWNRFSKKLIIGCSLDTIGYYTTTRSAVYSIDLNQKQLEYLTECEGGGAVLSPDGQEIVYDNPRRRSIEVKSLVTDSTRIVIQCDDPKGLVFGPSWSHDGKRIVYIYTVEGEKTNEVRTISVINSEITTIFVGTKEYPRPWDPHWSPDGNNIAFSIMSTGNVEVWVMENFIPKDIN